MTYTAFYSKNSTPDQIESMLESIESTWHCHITVHDITGCLSTEAGRLELGGRSVHTHPYCQWRRTTNPRWHHACNQHCLTDMSRLVTRGPGCHTCWKGAKEVVAPILSRDTHLLTIFAGAFQGPPVKGHESNSAWQQRWAALPAISDDQMHHLSQQLQMLGSVLLNLTRAPPSTLSSRSQLIKSFLQHHAHQPITLAELATTLGVSPRQCSRLVKQLTGYTFQHLLLQERLKRAAILIANYDLPLKIVAARVGFADQYHLSKAFKKQFGLPPKQWRKQTIST